MRALLALALLALGVPPPGQAGVEDLLVAGPGRGVLDVYDGGGQPRGSCDVQALAVAVKFVQVHPGAPVHPAALERSLFAVAMPLSSEGSADLCPAVALLSPRAEYIDRAEGDWASGWVLEAQLDFDVVTLTTGPYGDGHGIPFRLEHATTDGHPVLALTGTFDDAGAPA
jgi:hypothetical protein